MKKIGLFGGSFDPIHKAHVDIAKLAIEQFNLDEVQLIPTKNNPWKDSSCASSSSRVEMIELATLNETKITMNPIELNMDTSTKNYTIDTIEMLKQANPDVQYYYIMGMDQANLFGKWKDASKISQLVQLVAFQRGGYIIDPLPLDEYHFLVLDNVPVYASSSDVRNGHIEMLDPLVLKYITQNGLYLETIVACRMKEKRWKHTCSVAKLAAEIAYSNGLNQQQAYIAGMFHDIAKEMEYEKLHLIMQNHYSQYLDKPVALWHQWVSRYVSEHEYLIDDEVILKAIEHHTTVSIDISPIGKCVYVADKLDPLRGYDSSSQIEICKKDIQEGFRNSLIEFYEFSTKQGRHIDECFYEIYDYFVTKGEI